MKSNDPNERIAAVDWLLGMKDKGFDAFSSSIPGGIEEAKFLKSVLDDPVNNEIGYMVTGNNYFEFGFPVFFAAVMDFTFSLEILIEKGARIDEIDEEDKTSLHDAVERGYDKGVMNLIMAGANIEAQDGVMQTPLILAVNNNNISAVEILISKGVDVNKKGLHSWTALHYACANGKKEIAGILIEYKADINSLNRAGKTPLDLNLLRTAPGKFEKLLRAHGGKTGEELRKEAGKK
ncbi:MAG: ankyrin repeat domain-containing protein [Planctomycetota bacterium]